MIHNLARERFAYLVSAKAAADEVVTLRMLGVDWSDAYAHAWAIGDEVVSLVLDVADKPSVHLEPRTITGKMKI
jgi:hypothetical protein